MSASLVECIPNFSEARRPEVVKAILEAITSVSGVQVLDHHSDLDHNRTVVTFLGPPAAVEEAAYQGIARAAELIDMDQHTGEHPRLGATDVVPFVPISDIKMDECVEIARRLGKRVGDELGIPVYLYEEAASRPDRQGLENIRRGQYEGLKTEIETNPERQPDFGPAKLGRAGATVIGARQPLIAYNVYLNTGDVEIARKIARTVRNSSGGLRYVKAMGILVEGLAQVSMNLTNFRGTPIAQVVEMIRREAQRYGAAVHHCELVGLTPQQALFDAARWYLQLDGFEPEQVLEQRLFNLTLTQTPDQPSDFLEDLASENPTPGGGSAAAYTAAQAAALVAMVGRVTVGKKKYANVEQQMQQMIDKAETLRTSLTRAVAEDSAAFDAFMQALRLPKNTPEEQSARQQALNEATLGAARVPLQVAERAADVIALAVEAADTGNINAVSDAGTAAALAAAALSGAGLNVRTNLKDYEDRSAADPMLSHLVEIEQRAAEYRKQLHAILKERAGLDLH
jgi:glutamate formiminotransferase/formiminotetrahydrofolate cyclodeaminase